MKLTPEEGAQRAHRFGQHQVQRYGAASMEDWWRWRLKVSIWERDDRPGVLTIELLPWSRVVLCEPESVVRWFGHLLASVKRGVARNVKSKIT